MRRTLLALVSAATLAIALVGPATAITGNYVEDFDHPFVGAHRLLLGSAGNR